jgi:SAM-dependent methyltransferase
MMRSYRGKGPIPEDVLRRIGAKAREFYSDAYALVYREGDNAGLSDWTHVSWCERLRKISASFDKPIAVLDLGCGTGRYFHCLQNAQSLVGVDVSESMLKIAKENPVRQVEITACDIHLIHDDIQLVTFPADSFDFVYCVGVFGDFIPISLTFIARIREWLKSGGVAFMTIMESQPPRAKTWKERVARALYPVLPHRVKVFIDIRLGDFMVTRNDLEELMREAGFRHFEINRQVQRRTFLFVTAHK